MLRKFYGLKSDIPGSHQGGLVRGTGVGGKRGESGTRPEEERDTNTLHGREEWGQGSPVLER